MATKKHVGLKVLTDIRRFLPGPMELKRPLPTPKQGEVVMQGVTADVLSWALSNIPTVGDFLGDFANDNIMADALVRLTPEQQTEFRIQNRVYPNGIALLRTFQKLQTAPRSAA